MLKTILCCPWLLVCLLLTTGVHAQFENLPITEDPGGNGPYLDAHQWLQQVREKLSDCDTVVSVRWDRYSGEYGRWYVYRETEQYDLAKKNFPDGPPPIDRFFRIGTGKLHCREMIRRIGFRCSNAEDNYAYYRIWHLDELTKLIFYKSGVAVGALWVDNDGDLITDRIF